MLDDRDLQFPEQTPEPPPRRTGSRSFLLVAGILGAILLLALLGIAVYSLVILPGRGPVISPAQQTQTSVALALQVTPSPTITATTAATATRTPTRTNTPSSTPATIDPATETVNALLTSAALAQTQAATTATGLTATSGPTATASSLPQSGFAEDAGVPGLLALSAILILIIFAARRARAEV